MIKTQKLMKMAKFGLIGVFLLTFNASYSQSMTVSVLDGILIENAQVITANDKKEIQSYIGFVVTDGDRIAYVGSTKPVVSGGFETLNAEGKFLIPGLIDSHAHLANMAGMSFRQSRQYPELTKAYFDQLPKSFLYFGYTTLIDLNNYAPDLLKEIQSKKIRPDIFYCGEQVMVMNDFSMEMEEIPQANRYSFPFLNDRFNENVSLPDSIDLDAHSAQILVSTIVNDYEGICVKTLYEDASSGLPEFWEKPSKEIIQELVGEAHNNNLTVVLHAPSFEGQTFAMDAGVDIIAHAMWNWTSDPEKYMDKVLPQSHINLLEAIAKKQIGYQPTFRTITGESDILQESLLDDPIMNAVLPSAYFDWIKNESADRQSARIMGRHEFLSRVNPDFYFPIRNKFDSNKEMTDELYKSIITKINRVVKILSDQDANLLFGPDGVAMNMYTNPPGYNGFLEMKHWEGAGVSLEKIFIAATMSNAIAFSLNEEIGSIETGKRANLLLMNSNPLGSIGAYNNIEIVILRGKVIQRDRLSAVNN